MSEEQVYIVETRKEVLWSRRKMTTQYLHATEFLYRNKAKYREVSMKKLNQMKQYTDKKFIEIQED
jgi:hypothetical protein